MEMIRRMFGITALRERADVQDETISMYARQNKMLTDETTYLNQLCREREEKSISLLVENRKLTAIASEYDAQVTDMKAQLDRIMTAFTAAQSTKRMSKADRDAITAALFNLPEPETDGTV